MHLVSRTQCCSETAQRTGLLHQKTLTPFGSLVMCTDMYAGSVTDSDLTADCGVLDMIQEKGATVLTDKTYVMAKACATIALQ